MLINLENCSKTFDGNRALDQVSLDIGVGEVHGLIGQNGSGKSTLIKILAGFVEPDRGTSLTVSGRDVPFPMVGGTASRLGFSFVHQDLALFDQATVLENLSIGMLHSRAGWRIPWRSERRRFQQTLKRFDVDVPIDVPVGGLSPADKAGVAIARALERLSDSGNGCLLVLDEPTVHMSRDGIDRLFSSVNLAAKSGVSVLLVTHRMDEILDNADRVTVLRDGAVAATGSTADLDEASLSRALLGFELPPLASTSAEPSRSAPVRLRLDGVKGKVVNNVTLHVREGEVVGLTGISGAGWEEVPLLLFGAAPVVSGTVAIGDREFANNSLSPRRAMRAGLAFIPGDRARDGLVLAASVRENVTLVTLGKYAENGRIRYRKEAAAANEIVREFQVHPQRTGLPVRSLSGGNQQKLVIAKWFQTAPAVMLLHEPTQGVDVGARQYIYERLREAAAVSGMSVVIASAEYEDLSTICDRVMVFRNGEIACELHGEALTHERVLTEAVTS
jgi:ribose transport system ATP-binding protein